MTASLILCFLRHLSEGDAFECLEQALPLRDKIVGIGLASSEVGHHPCPTQPGRELDAASQEGS
jgi:adenosine deaminase